MTRRADRPRRAKTGVLARREGLIESGAAGPCNGPPVAFAPMEAADVAGAAGIEAGVADGWSADGIAAALTAPAARCWVARCGGAVAAFAAFTFAAGEANLDALSVAPAFRRQGIAGRLLSIALEELAAQGADCCYLEVRASNTPAQALYRSLGFQRVGLRPRFYKNPTEDAVLMQKRL